MPVKRDRGHMHQGKMMRLLVRHMGTSPQTDRLQTLQANLQHFNLSPDFGDGEAVAAIRVYLIVRIREAEDAIRCGQGLERRGLVRRGLERLAACAPGSLVNW